MAAAGPAEQRRRGFILVLIVDEKQAPSEHESIARVCRDYDVQKLSELTPLIDEAAGQVSNQVELLEVAERLLQRA